MTARRFPAGCTSPLLLACALAASACGGETGPRVSEQEGRRLALAFATALLESPNQRAAIRAARRIAEPAVVEDVEFCWEKPTRTIRSGRPRSDSGSCRGRAPAAPEA